MTIYDTREGARLLLNRERRPNCFAFSQQAFCIHRKSGRRLRSWKPVGESLIDVPRRRRVRQR